MKVDAQLILSFALLSMVIWQQLYIFLSENRHNQERKDLLNRLMAKDTREYVNISGGSTDKKVINPVARNIKEDLRKQGILRQE
ncbi:hypothetical protein [Marinisporobacter balticus]|uniref:Uncharacterized protein n=1 Tax=Marinisporobacter balticus TaxID=2018667 RepID=A0A4R2L5F7_9FIRM|nr:hypothetical protein [Marinisporobacter balticus]TCO79126.1 hypothetical protein EV214_103178 [Marinisporobacter balticus]